MSSTDWWSLGINALRDELRKRGLETYGGKAQMAKRLQNYEENYKRRMEALKSKQKSTYSSTNPGAVEYKVVDEWKSTDEKSDSKKSDVKETEKSNKTTEKAANGSVSEKPPNYYGMTMSELRRICEEKGLSTIGSKYDVVDRLKTFDEYQKKKKKDVKPLMGTSPKPSTPSTPKTTASSTSASSTPKSTGTPASAVTTTTPKSSSATSTSSSATKTTTPGEAKTSASAPKASPAASSTQSKIISATTKAPAPTTQAKPTETPAKPGATPTKPGATPTKPGATPTKPGATPVKPTTTPVKPSTTPVKPVATPAKPIASSAQPVTTSAKPVTTPTRPGVVPAISPIRPPATTAAAKTSPTTPKAAGAAKTTPATVTSAPTVSSAQEIATKIAQNQKKYSAMTFAQLKIECVNRKINIQGSKPDIIKRLLDVDRIILNTPEPASPVKPFVIKQSTEPITFTAPQGSVVTLKPMTSDIYIQAKPTMMTKFAQSDLINLDEPKKKDHYKYFTTETIPYVAGRRKEWSNTKSLPDLVKDIIPDMEHDAQIKTLFVYPVTFIDLLHPCLVRWRNNCKDCVIRFQNEASITKSMNGSVEFRFFTRQQVDQAMKEIRAWKPEMKLEKPSKKRDSDALLRSFNSISSKQEPLVNRMIFLNKIAANVKEGNLASKFLDAASVVIARDADLTYKGYGYVEYLSREAAVNAMQKLRILDVDRVRIDMKLFTQVPALAKPEMQGLVMADADRVKMAEKYQNELQQRMKNKSFGKNDARDKALEEVIEKLEQDLALDAAMRKKLGYEKLPEPVVYQTPEQRKQWDTGVFSNVDLGSVKEIWANPREAEVASRQFKEAREKEAREKLQKEQAAKATAARNEGPPPAKQSRFESTSTQSGRASSRDRYDNRDQNRQGFGNSRHGNKDREDDLRHKEPLNTRQGNQGFGANSKSSAPSLMGAPPRESPKSSFGSSGNLGGGGLMGEYPGTALNSDMSGGRKPGLLSMPGQQHLRSQGSGSGSPMEFEDSRPNKFQRTGSQSDISGGRNQSGSRYDSGSNQFGNQRGGAGRGLLGEPKGSGGFGQDKIPSLFDAQQPGGFGRGKSTEMDNARNQGSNQQFAGSSRGGTAPGGVPSLLGNNPTRTNQSTGFGSDRAASESFGAEDRYGSSSKSEGSQFGFGRDRGGRDTSFQAQKDDPSFGFGRALGGPQNDQQFDQKQTRPFVDQMGRGRSMGRGTDQFDTKRDERGFGKPGRGRGGNDPYGQQQSSQQQRPLMGRRGDADSSIFGAAKEEPRSSFGRPSRFNDSRTEQEDNIYGKGDESFRGDSSFMGGADTSYHESLMDQPLQFRRTPGAKDPQPRTAAGRFGQQEKEPDSRNQYGQGRSQGQYGGTQGQYGGNQGRFGSQSLSQGQRSDPYGDQKPWTDDYDQYGGGNRKPETRATSGFDSQRGGRGLADTINQLLPTLGRGDADKPGSYIMGAPQKPDRLAEATKVASAASGVDFAALRASISQHTGIQMTGPQSSFGAKPAPALTDEDYYQQGVAAKYGSSAKSADPYARNTGHGAGSSTASALPPWQKADPSRAPPPLHAPPLEEMSVDLLKELSSKVSALRTQMRNENISTGSPQVGGMRTHTGGDTTKSTPTSYKGAALSYGDTTKQHQQQKQTPLAPTQTSSLYTAQAGSTRPYGQQDPYQQGGVGGASQMMGGASQQMGGASQQQQGYGGQGQGYGSSSQYAWQGQRRY